MSFDHLSALVRAVARLRPDGALDPALVDALARLLVPDAEARTGRPATLEVEPQPAKHRADSMTTPAEVERSPVLASSPAHSARDTTVSQQEHDQQDLNQLVGLPATLTLRTQRADLSAPQKRDAGPLRAQEQASAEPPLASAPMESLFPANRVRAILRDMAARSTPSGLPDIAAALKLIANAQPIARLTPSMRTTLGHTIVLLFDAGKTMLPFARDKQQLASTALRLLGKDRVRIADFLGDPLRGVRPQRQVRWQSLRWPKRGSTLVLVTDLGIGEPSLDPGIKGGAGLTFLEECKRRDLRSVALVPYPRERWPALAADFDAALTWDLDMGVQALRHSAHHRR